MSIGVRHTFDWSRLVISDMDRDLMGTEKLFKVQFGTIIHLVCSWHTQEEWL